MQELEPMTATACRRQPILDADVDGDDGNDDDHDGDDGDDAACGDDVAAADDGDASDDDNKTEGHDDDDDSGDDADGDGDGYNDGVGDDDEDVAGDGDTDGAGEDDGKYIIMIVAHMISPHERQCIFICSWHGRDPSTVLLTHTNTCAVAAWQSCSKMQHRSA